MADKKTTLTREEYLMALGLYTLARQACDEGNKAEAAMAKVLGLDDRNDLGHIQDEIYSPSEGFDKALERQGFTVLE